MSLKTRFLVFVISFLVFSASSAEVGEDIDNLAETSKWTADTFMRKSFALRMEYEYNGRFLKPDNRGRLYKLAKTAGENLGVVAKSQEELKRQIENYPGDDWESKYGATSLWRKLSGQWHRTVLSKYEIDLCAAISSERPLPALQEILGRINSLKQIYDTAYLQFLKAKTLGLLSRMDATYEGAADREFNALGVRSDIFHSTAFKAEIERWKLLGVTEAGQLSRLTEELVQSEYGGDIELVLSLAFLQRRYDTNAFGEIIRLWPQTEDFLGDLILSRLSVSQPSEQVLGEITVLEAELAVEAARRKGIGDYQGLLEQLIIIDKFQTAFIMYTTAVTIAESEAAKAVGLLVEASKLQSVRKSGRLEIPAYKIAEQAGQLGYNLFLKDRVNCRLALGAFENHQGLIGDKNDEELEYLYAVVLNGCGRRGESKELLEKISIRGAGTRWSRAKLDLIIRAIQQGKLDERGRELLARQLNDLIVECRRREEREVETEATGIYCQLLFEAGDEKSAQKILAIPGGAETTGEAGLDIFKSKALQQLNRLEEASKVLVGVVRRGHCEYSDEVLELLGEIAEQVDMLELRAEDFVEMMRDCKNLAEFAYGCKEGREAGILLAEITVFAAEGNGELSNVEDFVGKLSVKSDGDDVDLLRCRGRLLCKQGEFEEASWFWSQIARIRKDEGSSAKRQSWKWWRAKYYELFCWVNGSGGKKEDVAHTIEVLENSYEQIPPLWGGKLGLLKQQCGGK